MHDPMFCCYDACYRSRCVVTSSVGVTAEVSLLILLDTCMASKARLKEQVEDELRTFFVCPEALLEQLQQIFGAGDRLLSKIPGHNSISTDDAEVHYERARHLKQPDVFGPTAPQVSQQQVLESRLHGLLFSNNSRVPGFRRLCSMLKPSGQADAQEERAPSLRSALLRLLRRVSSWYYYRVMFDPLEDLVTLNSSYELLFQLLTPHQQLSCMADILLVLACPSLEQHSDQLDTPLHTATLLSMLKMAEQLALSEATLQEQQQQLSALHDAHLLQQDQHQGSQHLRHLHHQQQCLQAANSAASTLVSPAAALLRVSRQHLDSHKVLHKHQAQQHKSGLQCPHRELHALLCDKLFGILCNALVHQCVGRAMHGIGSQQAQAALQQLDVCRATGALLSQLCQLPHKQFLLWWHAQEPEQQAAAGWQPTHTAAVACWLRQCCSALQAGGGPLPELKEGEDPVLMLLAWVMKAMSGPDGKQHSSTAGESHHGDEQPAQHPAEALRQLLDVLLCAMQFRHQLAMEQCPGDVMQLAYARLLAGLHFHCMQLLTEAREQLPPEAYHLGCNGSEMSTTTTDMSYSSSSSVGELQKQHMAWQRCCTHVQHDLLLMLQLMKHTQGDITCDGMTTILTNRLCHYSFLRHIIAPTSHTDAQQAEKAAEDQVRQRLTRHKARLCHQPGQSEQQRQSNRQAAQQLEALWALTKQRRLATQQLRHDEPLHLAAAPATSSTGALGNAQPSPQPHAAAAPAAGAASGATCSNHSSCGRRSSDPGGGSAGGSSSSGGMQSTRLQGEHALVALCQEFQEVLHQCEQAKDQGCVHPELQELCRACGFKSWEDVQVPAEMGCFTLQAFLGCGDRPLVACILGLLADGPDTAQLQLLGKQLFEVTRILGDAAAAGMVVEAWEHRVDLVVQQQLRRQQGRPATTAAGQLSPVEPDAAAAVVPASLPAPHKPDAGGKSSPPSSPVLRLKGGKGGSSVASSETGESATEDLQEERQQQQQEGGGEQQPPQKEAQQESFATVPQLQGAALLPAADSEPGRQSQAPVAASAAATEGSVQRWLQSGISRARAADACQFDELVQVWRQRLLLTQHDKPAPVGVLPVAAASDEDFARSSMPSQQSGHFQGMSEAAACAWLDLLQWSSQAAPSWLQPVLQRLQNAVVDLGLLSPAKLSTAGCSRDMLLAASTMALMGSDFSSSANPAHWHNFRSLVLSALDAAVNAALLGCAVPCQRMHRKIELCSDAVLRKPLEQLLRAAGLERVPNLDAGLNDIHGAVTKWIEYMVELLRALGGEEVKAYNQEQPQDDDLRLLPDDGKRCEYLRHWMQRFDWFLTSMQALVQLDAWLAHHGRHVQKASKVLRHLVLALAAGSSDQRLLMLKCLLKPLDARNFRVMIQLVISHKLLRAYLEAYIIPEAWRVIQRAFNLKEMAVHMGLRNVRNVCEPTLCSLLESMCTYLCRTHPDLPSPRLLQRWRAFGGTQLEDWGEIIWQELLITFASIQPPIASCWFWLASQEDESSEVTSRANPHMLLSDSQRSRHRHQAGSTSRPSSAPSSSTDSSQHAVGDCAGQHGHSPTAAAAAADASRTSYCCSASVSSTSGVRPASRTGDYHSRVIGRSLACAKLELPGCGYCSSDEDVAVSHATEAVEQAEASARALEHARKLISTCEAALGLGDPNTGLQQGVKDGQQREQTLQQQLREVEELQQLWRTRCRQCMQERASSSSWRDSFQASLRPSRAVVDSTSSCSSSSLGSDSGDNEAASSSTVSPMAGPTGSARLPVFKTAKQQEERRLQRKRRKVVRDVPSYNWGGSRPWHLQRMRVLTQRQQLLNRVDELQDLCSTQLAKLQALHQQQQQRIPTGTTALSSQQQQQQLQASSFQQQQQVCQGLIWDAAAALSAGSPAQASPAACAAAAESKKNGGTPPTAAATAMPAPAAAQLMMIQLRAKHNDFHGNKDRSEKDKPALTGLWEGLSVVRRADQQDPLGAVTSIAQRLQEALQALQDIQSSSNVALLLGLGCGAQGRQQQRQQQQQEGGEDGGEAQDQGGSASGEAGFRQLLWDVLCNFKPAARPWYQHAAQHHQKQDDVGDCVQHTTGAQSAAARPDGSTAAPDDARSVPDCSSGSLWSTLCHSIASDLLLVPPSIRDMVGNDWAGGAGRLGSTGGGIDGSSSSSSSSSGAAGVAARMLVVQYARAARRQYAQGYTKMGLLGQLLVLQLLAEGHDALKELQPQSEEQLIVALSLQSNMAAAGMVPMFAAAAAACNLASSSSSSTGLQGTPHTAAAFRPGNGRSSSPGQLHHPPASAACSSTSSYHAPADKVMHPSSGPSLLHLAAQLGCCFPGSAEVTLPWLQLMVRYHAYLADVDKRHAAAVASVGRRSGPTEGFKPHCSAAIEARMFAMQAGLQSFGVSLPSFAAQLCSDMQAEYARCGQRPLVATPFVNPALGGLRGPCGRQQRCALGQGQGQQALQHLGSAPQCGKAPGADAAPEKWGYWLHAQRLQRVSPADWQQHVAEQLRDRGSSRFEADSSSKGSSEHVALLADGACDWCCQQLQGGGRTSIKGAATADSNGRRNGQSDSSRSYGCPSCGVAQYCSQACAEAAKKVHQDNCWRLQALASNGTCWQQPTCQQTASSKQSRSFWDLRAVERAVGKGKPW